MTIYYFYWFGAQLRPSYLHYYFTTDEIIIIFVDHELVFLRRPPARSATSLQAGDLPYTLRDQIITSQDSITEKILQQRIITSCLSNI